MLSVWQLDVNERLQKTFVITNNSLYDFDFTWELKADGRAVSIGPTSGRLEHGRSEHCQLTFTSQRPVILKHCQLVLRVSRVLLLLSVVSVAETMNTLWYDTIWCIYVCPKADGWPA